MGQTIEKSAAPIWLSLIRWSFFILALAQTGNLEAAPEGRGGGIQDSKELFSTDQPLTVTKRVRTIDQVEKNRHGLTVNGLPGLTHTETVDKFEPHQIVFGGHYIYAPWNNRYRQDFSSTETGSLQTWLGHVMYPTDNGDIAVTVPFHFYDLSAPRLFGTPATEHAGLGDVKLAGKLTWFPPQRYYRFGAGAIVEMATGDSKYLRPAGVTGDQSVKLFANVSTRETNYLRGHAQLGYIFNDDGFDQVFFYSLAFDYKLSDKTTFATEFVGHEGPAGYGSNLDFIPTVRIAISDNFTGELSSPFNLYLGREFGWDYKIQFGSSYRW